MEDSDKIETLTKNVQEYINIRVEIVKLLATDKASSILAKIVFGFIVSLVALLFVIFISMALGYYMSTLTGSTFSGFLIVTGLHLIMGLVLISYRKKLVINPIRNILIRQILSHEE